MKRKRKRITKSTARKAREKGLKEIQGWTKDDFVEVAAGGDVVILPSHERHSLEDELRRLHNGELRGHAL